MIRLSLTTPQELVAVVEGVHAVHAEDASGSFTILPGHADFLAVLAVSVLSWQGADGAEHRAAIGGGVLSVRGGREVAVATRQAVLETEPGGLGSAVLARLRAEEAEERAIRREATRLELAAWRRLERYLIAARDGARPPDRWLDAEGGA